MWDVCALFQYLSVEVGSGSGGSLESQARLKPLPCQPGDLLERFSFGVANCKSSTHWKVSRISPVQTSIGAVLRTSICAFSLIFTRLVAGPALWWKSDLFHMLSLSELLPIHSGRFQAARRWYGNRAAISLPSLIHACGGGFCTMCCRLHFFRHLSTKTSMTLMERTMRHA